MTNIQRIGVFVAGLLIGGSLVFAVDATAGSTPAPKTDCSVKKNAKKIECKEAPKSDVEKKAVVKKPEKVRKAPSSVQKKAAENTK
jgi:uncharacterized protein YycO